MAKAYFAAGCFWGVEEAFRQLQGVTRTSVGYGGGKSPHPSYKEVCGGNSGHAEVVEVEFDPGQTSYQKMLEAFWDCHDPTTLNRQGPDVGSQYRSAIFTLDETQQKNAVESKKTLENTGHLGKKVVTEITPYTNYYLAEDYHQQYIAKRRESLPKRPFGGLFSSARAR